MSPSEADLRAALRDGEDDGVDVDGLVAAVRGRRTQRRARVASTAAAVVVVAAAAVGGAVVWGGSNGGHQQADRAATPGASPSFGVSTGRLPRVTTTCPGLPSVPLDGHHDAAARSGAMFAKPVAAVQVCTYVDSGAGRSLMLIGTDATALAASIERASPDRAPILCPDITTGQTTLLALVPVTADGTVLPTVTTDISVPDCNRPITNGTAVRYNWRPPQSLTAQLAAHR